MTNLLALPSETVLAGDYKIRRVLGAGGFGITYLADEIALNRQVTIKEYFPADFAARIDDVDAVPRSKDCAEDYKWGLDRFIEEAQTLARFEHPNIVRVFRYFRENKTGYMVLQFEEGKSLRNWLKELGRAPRQLELDQFLGPLLDALEMIHKRDFLHRDIAPDNIIMRKDRSPVLIDFGSARGEIASQSRTVSALVKPGYSPYEQYATTTSQQGPWTDIYALGATLYQAVTGKRPPDSPSRVVKDEYVPARDAAVGSYRPGFLAAIDKALCVEPKARPQSVLEWRGPLLAPPEKPAPVRQKLAVGLGLRKVREAAAAPTAAVRAATVVNPPLPDAPQPQGQLLDYIESLKQPEPAPAKGAPTRLGTRLTAAAPNAQQSPPDLGQRADQGSSANNAQRHGIGYGPAPMTMLAAPQPIAPPVTPVSARGRSIALPARAKAQAASRLETVVDPQPIRRVEPMPIRRKKSSLATRATFFLRQPWRGLLFKFGIGLGVASVAVAYQNQLPQAVLPTPQKSAAAPRAANTVTSPAATRDVEARPLVQVQGHKGPVVALGLVNAGRRMVSIGVDGAARIAELETGVVSRTIPLGLPQPVTVPSGPAISPTVAPVATGAALIAATVAGDQLLAAYADGTVAIWDLDRGERIASTRRLDGSVTAVAPTGEPERVAAAGADGKVMLLDRRTGNAPTLSGDAHKDAIAAIMYVPDRNGLITASADKTLKFWDAESLNLKRTYRGHNGPVTALDIAADGRSFASGAQDGQIRLWSTASNRLIRTLRAHATSIAAVAFSKTGDILASGASDGSVKLHDVKRGKDVAAFQTRAGSVRGLMFTADGRRLITASEDGSVKIWDISPLRIARE